MKRCEVHINGTIFLVDFGLGIESRGFCIKIYVLAENDENARYVAMDMFRKNKVLRGSVYQNKDDPPVMCAEEMIEIEKYDEFYEKVRGHVCCLESGTEDVQQQATPGAPVAALFSLG